MPTRIVVANQAQADFYDAAGPQAALRFAQRLDNPAARIPDRDLGTDRPGRVFDRAATSGVRRGATGHHATGGERSPRRQAATVFARRIAADLSAARESRRFDRLMLIAAPAFLGVLRKALPKALRASVVAEVAKDLIGEPKSAVRARIPQNALFPLR